MGPQSPLAEPRSEVRVSASAKTAIPLAVEIETELGGGWAKVDVVEPITCNAAFVDVLFDDSAADGFELHVRVPDRPTR